MTVPYLYLIWILLFYCRAQLLDGGECNKQRLSFYLSNTLAVTTDYSVLLVLVNLEVADFVAREQFSVCFC